MNSTSITESVFSTRWTLIHQARDPLANPGASRAALEAVVRRYRPAILGAVQRNGINPAECEDACQEFLVTTFLNRTLPKADKSKGKFRTFLIHTLRLFLIDYRRRLLAEKRGHLVTRSLEELSPADEAEAALSVLPRMELDFEIDLACCMHNDVLAELREEYAKRRQLPVFESLVPFILEREAGLDDELGERLGMQETAVRKALSRLRKRYGEAFLLRTAHITDEDENAREEMKQLLKLVLAKSRMQLAQVVESS
jgi:RNA polymerase sigma-70 factor (ECF subfamily)